MPRWILRNSSGFQLMKTTQAWKIWFQRSSSSYLLQNQIKPIQIHINEIMLSHEIKNKKSHLDNSATSSSPGPNLFLCLRSLVECMVMRLWPQRWPYNWCNFCSHITNWTMPFHELWKVTAFTYFRRLIETGWG